MACGKTSPWISTADLSLISAPLVRYTACFYPKPSAAVCPNPIKIVPKAFARIEAESVSTKTNKIVA